MRERKRAREREREKERVSLYRERGKKNNRQTDSFQNSSVLLEYKVNLAYLLFQHGSGAGPNPKVQKWCLRKNSRAAQVSCREQGGRASAECRVGVKRNEGQLVCVHTQGSR